MSGTSLAVSGMLGQLIAESAAIHRNLDQLTERASTGRIADTYAGLGSGARTSLDLRPQIAANESWQANIDAADTRMQVTQTAMTQLTQIASSFNAQLNNLDGLDSGEVASVAASARAALQDVAGLLDTQAGGMYVFAGQDTANPPVPNPDSILSSGFYTQIATAVSGLSGAGAAATAASTLAIASSNAPGTTPFSSYLSQPAASVAAPVIQTGDGQFRQVGLLASANSLVASSGTSTTGSYMRDLMRALATIGSLTPSQVNDPSFAPLIQDTRASLSGAIDAMGQEAGAFGNIQSELTSTQNTLADTEVALKTQVSNAEDVDMAATLSQLSTVQTQLQASYQLINTSSSLTLAKFLPVS